jgi:hypothetical protein
MNSKNRIIIRARSRIATAQAFSGSVVTVAVGAHSEESTDTGINGSGGDNTASGSGAAYLFARSGNS